MRLVVYAGLRLYLGLRCLFYMIANVFGVACVVFVLRVVWGFGAGGSATRICCF